MEPVDIGKLRELMAKATPGEWGFDKNHTIASIDVDEWGLTIVNIPGDLNPQDLANAELICGLHNAAPALLDELEAARADREFFRTELNKWRENSDKCEKALFECRRLRLLNELEDRYAELKEDETRTVQETSERIVELEKMIAAEEARLKEVSDA